MTTEPQKQPTPHEALKALYDVTRQAPMSANEHDKAAYCRDIVSEALSAANKASAED